MFVDTCVSRRQFYGSETAQYAYLAILKHIALSGDSSQDLMKTFERSSREDIGCVFSGVIRLWLDCIGVQIQNDDASRDGNLSDPLSGTVFAGAGDLPQIPIDQSFYDREQSSLANKIVDADGPLYNVIKFTAKAAEQKTAVRQGMLDAGCLALVLTAFANSDFRLSSLVSVPGQQGKGKISKSGRGEVSDVIPSTGLSLAAINTEASALSVLIRSAKFTKPWRGQRLETRLSLCSSLVDALLGKDELLDGEYEITHALFRNIVAADH